MGRDIGCNHRMDKNGSKRKVFTNTSSSSNSVSSSPSPFSAISSPIPIAPLPTKSSMENVWKDICLSTLPYPAKTTANPSTTGPLQGIIFQEFLPHHPNTNRSSQVPSHSTSHADACSHSSFRFGSQGPPASTILSLNPMPPASSFSHLPQNDIHRLDSSSLEFSILPKKRVPQNEDSYRQNKRVIKNRESAARSRARKQAYTNDLEIKVASLMEENATLRRQQEKLCLDAAAKFPKKHMLCRTLTAPF